MADIHHQHAGPAIEERNSSAFGVLVAFLIAGLVAFFVWLIAFSGVVIDRGNDGGSTTRIEQNVDNPGNAPANTDTQPSPATS